MPKIDQFYHNAELEEVTSKVKLLLRKCILQASVLSKTSERKAVDLKVRVGSYKKESSHK